MTLGEIFIKLGLKSEGFEKGIDGAKQKTGAFGSSFKEIGLMAAGIWAAIGAGAVIAFNKIKNSSDTLSTQWDVFMGGMKGATDEFFRSIAIGDWSNFIDNMKEAIRVGREYQSMLDEIEEQGRALNVQEANKLKENTQLEIDAANTSLSIDVRKKAAEQRIKNEEELSDIRIKLAQKVYDNEKMITQQQTRLSSEYVEKIIADFDSVDKQRAKSYNEDYDHMIAVNSSKIAVENELSKRYTDSEKLYGKALRQMGDTTDEQLNKMVAAYTKLKQAEESVIGNTRRVRQRLGALANKEEEDSVDKITEAQKELNKTISGSTGYYQAEIALLEAKQLLITDPRLLEQSKKEIALKKEYLALLTNINYATSYKGGAEPVSATPTIKGTIKTNGVDTKKLSGIGDYLKLNKEKSDKLIEEYNKFNESLNSAIQQGLADCATTFAEGIGNLITGDMNMKDFGKSLLSAIGSFLKQFGELLILYAMASLKFKTAFADPLGALAAGIALVAIGSALSNMGSKGVSESTSSGSTSSGSSSSNTSNSVAANNKVVFEIKGTSLVGVLNNVDRKNSLIR